MKYFWPEMPNNNNNNNNFYKATKVLLINKSSYKKPLKERPKILQIFY